MKGTILLSLISVFSINATEISQKSSISFDPDSEGNVYVNTQILKDREDEAKENAELRKKEQKTKKDQDNDSKYKEMRDNMDKFSSELDTQFLDKALKLKEKLDDNGYDAHPLDIAISTDKLYQKGFTIPGVAKNEYSAKQFEILEIAESNLNNNLENKNLVKKFI